MQKIGKRILSLLLTLVMLLGIIPVIPQVSAANGYLCVELTGLDRSRTVQLCQ